MVLKESATENQHAVVEDLRHLVATKIAKYAVPDNFLVKAMTFFTEPCCTVLTLDLYYSYIIYKRSIMTDHRHFFWKTLSVQISWRFVLPAIKASLLSYLRLWSDFLKHGLEKSWGESCGRSPCRTRATWGTSPHWTTPPSFQRSLRPINATEVMQLRSRKRLLGCCNGYFEELWIQNWWQEIM